MLRKVSVLALGLVASMAFSQVGSYRGTVKFDEAQAGKSIKARATAMKKPVPTPEQLKQILAQIKMQASKQIISLKLEKGGTGTVQASTAKQADKISWKAQGGKLFITDNKKQTVQADISKDGKTITLTGAKNPTAHMDAITVTFVKQ